MQGTERTAKNIVKDIGRDAALALTFANATDDLVAVSIPILEKNIRHHRKFLNLFCNSQKVVKNIYLVVVILAKICVS